jgi:hypothetical protein
MPFSRSRHGKHKRQPAWFEKARVACKPFGCVPYSAIVVYRAGTTICYLLPLDYLEKIAGGKS